MSKFKEITRREKYKKMVKTLKGQYKIGEHVSNNWQHFSILYFLKLVFTKQESSKYFKTKCFF
jgi:hypothetical protein